MSFLQWTFLFGAVAVIGPVVAHLLAKPRFRRVPFTMVRFLKSGQRQSHSRRKIRDLLVLLLRCAIIVLIAALFAQPVLHVQAEPQKQRPLHYLGLDDSMSMAYRDGGGSLFERMVEAALDHVKHAPDDVLFGIHALASGRSTCGLTKSQAVAEIKRLTVVADSVDLTDLILGLRRASLSTSPDVSVSALLVSDFTPSTLRQFEQVGRPAKVNQVQYEAVVPSEPVNNAAIVGACVTDAADNKLNIDVTVHSYGETEQQRTLTARIRDAGSVSTKLTLAPKQRRVCRVQMDVGPSLGASAQPYLPVQLHLRPEDGLIEDDTYRVAVYIPPVTRTNVLLVSRGDETFLFETAVKALSSPGQLKRLNLKKAAEDRFTAQDLAWADIAVFGSLSSGLARRTAALKDFLRGGGKLIFFTAQTDNHAIAQRLYREGLFPVLPDKWVQEAAYPQPRPCAGAGAGFDEQAGKSLVNYRLDRIPVKGYWLVSHEGASQNGASQEAECVWRFTNRDGFIYCRPCDGGLSVWVNTSIDDSSGLLAKSRAWVAFCQYLLGRADRIQQFCFSTAERPIVARCGESGPAALGQKSAAVWVENCDGRRMRARAEGAALFMPAPSGIGWMRTVKEPALYAAINLPAGETDMSRPASGSIVNAVKRAFVTDAEGRLASLRSDSDTGHTPIWKALAWLTIVLILFESSLANRLRR